MWPEFKVNAKKAESEGHPAELPAAPELSCRWTVVDVDYWGTKLLLFDICLDLIACSLVIFLEWSAFDALLTQHHGRSRLRVSHVCGQQQSPGDVEQEADFSCGKSTLGYGLKSHQSVMFPSFPGVTVNPICVDLPHLLSDFHRLLEHQLVAFPSKVGE